MEILFEGEGTVMASTGETILTASLRGGIPHYHACGGSGNCSTCRVTILGGMENLTHLTPREEFIISKTGSADNTRLACQAEVIGSPVRLERWLKDETKTSAFFRLDEDRRQYLSSLQPLGSEVELVLFFLDVRDYATLFRAALPYDVIHITRRLFDVFFRVVHDFGGKILETSGDQFYAVFGLGPSPAFVDLALMWGLRILEEVEKFNDVYIRDYLKQRLEVGIGMHYGKVVVADINLGFERRISVMGLAVVVAARIQDKTKSLNNSMLVTDDVVSRATLQFTHAEQRSVKLKGIDGDVVVHLVGQRFRHAYSSDCGQAVVLA